MSGTGLIDEGYLRRHPLPEIEVAAGKDERGTVLVIGGSRQVPGAILLAAEAALRAGAGKLQIATVASVATRLALAMPEARVIGLVETPKGEIDPASAKELSEEIAGADAVLVGPGMVEESGARALSLSLLKMEGTARFIFDAAALTGLRDDADALRECGRDFAITPHPGEMATFLGIDKDTVLDDPRAAGVRAAASLGGVVAMKGSTTFICSPSQSWQCEGGGIGMATSGSSDVLAGLIAGFAARGAPPVRAVQWGVFVHAEAGRRLGTAIGKVGYLARELSAVVPRILDEVVG
jgi:ADP-dependent NAD(P)H-hydrate dehydratase